MLPCKIRIGSVARETLTRSRYHPTRSFIVAVRQSCDRRFRSSVARPTSSTKRPTANIVVAPLPSSSSPSFRLLPATRCVCGDI
ncbi:hypothetical protein LWI29_000244 [Acer saccharum]|uniref:Uncharacterized protein n=1 Tax=Acer saccharum TaxID=4024 RepID=A0AA39RBB2_ACESA|nr:hypothetical protein LWI29_000244 [Acer saccharum]